MFTSRRICSRSSPRARCSRSRGRDGACRFGRRRADDPSVTTKLITGIVRFRNRSANAIVPTTRSCRARDSAGSSCRGSGCVEQPRSGRDRALGRSRRRSRPRSLTVCGPPREHVVDYTSASRLLSSPIHFRVACLRAPDAKVPVSALLTALSTSSAGRTGRLRAVRRRGSGAPPVRSLDRAARALGLAGLARAG